MWKGLIYVYTGDGKGKTTAALGQALRALGAGQSVYLIFFLKQNAATAEWSALKRFGESCRVVVPDQVHPMFGPGSSVEHIRQTTQQALAEALVAVRDGKFDLLILDEICNVLDQEYFDQADFGQFLGRLPASTHLILTGRGAPAWLVERADLVTECRAVKHPFQDGEAARKGIEF